MDGEPAAYSVSRGLGRMGAAYGKKVSPAARQPGLSYLDIILYSSNDELSCDSRVINRLTENVD